MSDGIDDYVVEIGVTGTWRESIVAGSEEEAQEVAEENLREHLNLEEGEWGDIGWRVIGSADGEANE